jgi:2,4-dienoyl-CoA reductase-like NADH-dependent reductase (Old Yellow Enzyme family)
VPPNFVIGIKLNASDYVSGQDIADAEKQAQEHIRDIASWGLDFIEISGGDYEAPGNELAV